MRQILQAHPEAVSDTFRAIRRASRNPIRGYEARLEACEYCKSAFAIIRERAHGSTVAATTYEAKLARLAGIDFFDAKLEHNPHYPAQMGLGLAVVAIHVRHVYRPGGRLLHRGAWKELDVEDYQRFLASLRIMHEEKSRPCFEQALADERRIRKPGRRFWELSKKR